MSKIPKLFYQCWNGNIPDVITNETKKNLPQDFVMKIFSHDEVRSYLLKNWGQDVLNLFNSYKRIPHKIDLWRYCILYDTGGIYMDADCVLKSNISCLLNNDSVFVINNRGAKDIFNGFIITTPKNPIFKSIIDYMINVKTNLEDDYFFNAKELYNIINRYINISSLKHNYLSTKEDFLNKKICVLVDKQWNDGYFYAFLNTIPILAEQNSLYPYPCKN